MQPIVNDKEAKIKTSEWSDKFSIVPIIESRVNNKLPIRNNQLAISIGFIAGNNLLIIKKSELKIAISDNY